MFEDQVWALVHCSKCAHSDPAIPAWREVERVLKKELKSLLEFFHAYDLDGLRLDYTHQQRRKIAVAMAWHAKQKLIRDKLKAEQALKTMETLQSGGDNAGAEELV